MTTMQIDKTKTFKKQLFETLYTRLDSTLVEYKDVIGEKKLTRFLKRTSKDLAGQISKRTKQAQKRQRKMEKRTKKLNKEERA